MPLCEEWMAKVKLDVSQLITSSNTVVVHESTLIRAPSRSWPGGFARPNPRQRDGQSTPDRSDPPLEPHTKRH
jgi:hypothetical protein